MFNTLPMISGFSVHPSVVESIIIHTSDPPSIGTWSHNSPWITILDLLQSYVYWPWLRATLRNLDSPLIVFLWCFRKYGLFFKSWSTLANIMTWFQYILSKPDCKAPLVCLVSYPLVGLLLSLGCLAFASALINTILACLVLPYPDCLNQVSLWSKQILMFLLC